MGPVKILDVSWGGFPRFKFKILVVCNFGLSVSCHIFAVAIKLKGYFLDKDFKRIGSTSLDLKVHWSKGPKLVPKRRSMTPDINDGQKTISEEISNS